MKLSLTIYKLPITLEYSRNADEEKHRAHKQYARDQRALLKLQPKQTAGNTYHHCTFGIPYPVGIQPPPQQEQAIDRNVIEYAATQTNLTTELVEQVLDAIDQYLADRGKR